MQVTPKILQALSQKYSLLYIEDDDIIRTETTEFLENYFKEVRVAKNGEEGLSAYNSSSFDIVLSDIKMPVMNGIELSENIMKMNKNQKIIIISAHNETNYFIDLIKIGVSNFIQKPLHTKEMLKVLYEVCIALDEEGEASRYVNLCNHLKWDRQLLVLNNGEEKIELTKSESIVFNLLVSNLGQTFNDIDIFNHVNYDDAQKEFSANSVKSLIKRLRQKLPPKCISNDRNIGYFINIS